MNLLNKRGAERTAELEKMERSLAEAEGQFRQNASKLMRRALNEMSGELLKLGGAEGLAGAQEVLGKWQERYDAIQKGLDSTDSKTRREALRALGEMALDVSKMHPALSKVLGPVGRLSEFREGLDEAWQMGDSLHALWSAADKIREISPEADADNDKLRDLILPIHKRLSDRLDAVRNDPAVRKCLTQ